MLHNQLIVSEHQLNQAIVLFLDDQDYYCSATLAGAAEEILGKLLKNRGSEPTLDNMIKSMLAMLSAEEVDALGDGKKRRPYAIMNDVLNFYRNWLKHYDENEFEIDIDSEEAACELIDRAVTNFFQLTGRESKQMRRFLEYQQKQYV